MLKNWFDFGEAKISF